MSDEHPTELSMTTPTARKPFWIFAAVSLVGIALLALPKRTPETPERDPALEAGEIVQAFVKQLTAASPGVPLADTTNPVRPVPLMRDPFAGPAGTGVAPPDAAPEPAADPYAVGGIFIDGASRFAVIGGRRVAEGDSLLGYWVAEITPRSVLLWRSDEFKRLSWSES